MINIELKKDHSSGDSRPVGRLVSLCMGNISLAWTSETTALTSFHIISLERSWVLPLASKSPAIGLPIFKPGIFDSSAIGMEAWSMRQKLPGIVKPKLWNSQCHFWQVPLVKASHRFSPYSGSRSTDCLLERWRNKVKGIYRKDERSLANYHKDLFHNISCLSWKSFSILWP